MKVSDCVNHFSGNFRGSLPGDLSVSKRIKGGLSLSVIAIHFVNANLHIMALPKARCLAQVRHPAPSVPDERKWEILFEQSNHFWCAKCNTCFCLRIDMECHFNEDGSCKYHRGQMMRCCLRPQLEFPDAWESDPSSDEEEEMDDDNDTESEEDDSGALQFLDYEAKEVPDDEITESEEGEEGWEDGDNGFE